MPFSPPKKSARSMFVNSRFGRFGSPTRSYETPVGRPVAVPSPNETWVKVAPPSVERKTPTLVKLKSSAKSTEAIRVLPRTATPEKSFPTSVPPPSIGVQRMPPVVLLSRPVRRPPASPKLLQRPIPATSVFRAGSVGSRSSAPIEIDAWSSVVRSQFGFAAVALWVTQMPPFTAPTQRMFGFVGWATTVWIAPTIGPSPGMFSTWPNSAGAAPAAFQGPPTPTTFSADGKGARPPAKPGSPKRKRAPTASPTPTRRTDRVFERGVGSDGFNVDLLFSEGATGDILPLLERSVHPLRDERGRRGDEIREIRRRRTALQLGCT